MKRIQRLLIYLLLFTMPLTACSTKGLHTLENEIDLFSLEKTEMELEYAQCYSMSQYGEYTYITIDSNNYIVVPEGKEVPKHDSDTTIIQQPLSNSYLVSTSVMSYLCELDVLDSIRFSGTKESGWTIESAISQMKSGKMLYAGKYSAPDYELLLTQGCDLAIENTMIYHNPEVKEKLEELEIPVLVERSSYESHPLGRLEWIKLYGILFNQYEKAESFFESQKELFNQIVGNETSKTVAFFSLSSNGSVVVRKPNDYIATMIKLAGGTYALDEVLPTEENTLSTMHMQMEDFYIASKDADLLIYNATIEGEVSSKEELVKKEKLFEDYKAYKNNAIYCTTQNFFQQSTGLIQFMKDLDTIYNEKEEELVYLKQVP